MAASFNQSSGNSNSSATAFAAARTIAGSENQPSTSLVDGRAANTKHITAPSTKCSSARWSWAAKRALTRCRADSMVAASSKDMRNRSTSLGARAVGRSPRSPRRQARSS